MLGIKQKGDGIGTTESYNWKNQMWIVDCEIHNAEIICFWIITGIRMQWEMFMLAWERNI